MLIFLLLRYIVNSSLLMFLYSHDKMDASSLSCGKLAVLTRLFAILVFSVETHIRHNIIDFKQMIWKAHWWNYCYINVWIYTGASFIFRFIPGKMLLKYQH